MWRLLALFLVSLPSLGAVGCSTHSTVVDYEGIEEFTVRAAPFSEHEVVGSVEGRHRGPVWESCSYAARSAVWKMIRQAKAMGANAVGDVYWRDGSGPQPRCKRRWFYALLFPVLCTPLFMDAEVHGTAYALSEPRAGAYVIP